MISTVLRASLPIVASSLFRSGVTGVRFTGVNRGGPLLFLLVSFVFVCSALAETWLSLGELRLSLGEPEAGLVGGVFR